MVLLITVLLVAVGVLLAHSIYSMKAHNAEVGALNEQVAFLQEKLADAPSTERISIGALTDFTIRVDFESPTYEHLDRVWGEIHDICNRFPNAEGVRESVVMLCDALDEAAVQVDRLEGRLGEYHDIYGDLPERLSVGELLDAKTWRQAS